MKIKRKELEIFLQNLEKASDLKIELEQYPTPSRVAANLLWYAGVENDDLFGKVVLDLGCGAGILAIGAAFLGANKVVGVDIDFHSIKTAKKNCEQTDLERVCDWVCADARECNLRGIDTTIMNPPFGMRKESNIRDRIFLETALRLSKVVYSINPSSEKTREFFRKFCKKQSAEIDVIIQMNFEIMRQFNFHKKDKHLIFVDLYRIIKN